MKIKVSYIADIPAGKYCQRGSRICWRHVMEKLPNSKSAFVCSTFNRYCDIDKTGKPVKCEECSKAEIIK